MLCIDMSQMLERRFLPVKPPAMDFLPLVTG
jgi:hypothetical protein